MAERLDEASDAQLHWVTTQVARTHLLLLNHQPQHPTGPPPAASTTTGAPHHPAAHASAASSASAGLQWLAGSAAPWSLRECHRVAQALLAGALAARARQPPQAPGGKQGAGAARGQEDEGDEEEEEEALLLASSSSDDEEEGEEEGGRWPVAAGARGVGPGAALRVWPGAAEELLLQLLLRHACAGAVWLSEAGHQQAHLLGPAFARARATAAAGLALRRSHSSSSFSSSTWQAPATAAPPGGQAAAAAAEGGGRRRVSGSAASPEAALVRAMPVPQPAQGQRLVRAMRVLAALLLAGGGLAGPLSAWARARHAAAWEGAAQQRQPPGRREAVAARGVGQSAAAQAAAGTLCVAVVRAAQRGAGWLPTWQLLRALRALAALGVQPQSPKWRGLLQLCLARRVEARELRLEPRAAAAATERGARRGQQSGSNGGAAQEVGVGGGEAAAATAAVARALQPAVDLLRALWALRMGTGPNLDQVLSHELLAWHLAPPPPPSGGPHAASPPPEQAGAPPPSCGPGVVAEAPPAHRLALAHGVLLDKDLPQLARLMNQAGMLGSSGLLRRLHGLAWELACRGRVRGKLAAGYLVRLSKLGLLMDPPLLAALAACGLGLPVPGAEQGGEGRAAETAAAAAAARREGAAAGGLGSGQRAQQQRQQEGGAARPLDLSSARALRQALLGLRYPASSPAAGPLREVLAELEGVVSARLDRRRGTAGDQQAAAQRLRACLERLARSEAASAASLLGGTASEGGAPVDQASVAAARATDLDWFIARSVASLKQQQQQQREAGAEDG